ncbi:MAG TPA: DUF2946 family protein [Xanthobacteraceae bacterium]
MLRARLPRRLTALAAAYALALQTLLAAMAVLAPDAAVASVICASDHHWQGTSDAPAPPAPGHDCPFCLLAGASIAAPPPWAAVAVRVDGAGTTIAPSRGALSATRAVARAGLARAPPA